MFKVNKRKCIGCGVCMANCPGAIRLSQDGRAEIINQKKLEKCGGESVCPMGAIEKISKKGKVKQRRISSFPLPLSIPPSSYRSLPPMGGLRRRMRRRFRGGRHWL